MGGRRLSPEEQARWAELARTVRPLPGRARPNLASDEPRKPGLAIPKILTNSPPIVPPNPAPRMPVDRLDGAWEKRVRAGTLTPEMSIDLHGHNLSSAHALLDRALRSALMQGVRTLLVVTGKPRESGIPHGEKRRGAIRAEIGHWIDSSPHRDAIASVRVAHPRHGGDGALYLILRRKR